MVTAFCILMSIPFPLLNSEDIGLFFFPSKIFMVFMYMFRLVNQHEWIFVYGVS